MLFPRKGDKKMEVFTPEFWEEQWNKAIQKSETRSNQEKIKIWNKRAENFNNNVSTTSGQKRIKETINFLDRYRILEGESKSILDIGCGPGHYAIEFARRGHEVYALDPAEQMIEKLEENLSGESKEVSDRITPATDDWLELDIHERGFYQKFDLAFASMSPGVSNTKTLQKTIDSTKGYCFFSRFSGQRFRPSIAYLLGKHIGVGEFSHLDIFYPVNWLYSCGYKPVIHFDRWSRIDPQPIEEAKQEIKQMASMFIQIDDQVERDIDEYLDVNEDNGYITEEKGATSGLVLFDVYGDCIKTIE